MSMWDIFNICHMTQSVPALCFAICVGVFFAQGILYLQVLFTYLHRDLSHTSHREAIIGSLNYIISGFRFSDIIVT